MTYHDDIVGTCHIVRTISYANGIVSHVLPSGGAAAVTRRPQHHQANQPHCGYIGRESFGLLLPVDSAYILPAASRDVARGAWGNPSCYFVYSRHFRTISYVFATSPSSLPSPTRILIASASELNRASLARCMRPGCAGGSWRLRSESFG